MTIRFQGDYDFNQDIIAGVVRREPGIDFQTGHAAGLKGLPDDEVLELAAQERRILVTHDRRTMPLHFAEFITGEKSPGVLILSQKTDLDTAMPDSYVGCSGVFSNRMLICSVEVRRVC